MRLGSELMGSEVRCRDGKAGTVVDVRLRQRAEPLRDVRVIGLVVSWHSWGSLFGYDRGEMGPKLVAAVVRLLHRNARYVPWELVAHHEPGLIEVRANRADLDPVPHLPGRTD
ncbi:MAG: hypothetical protein ACJ73S_22895 [Mycobacteriales bacterium]